MSSNPFFDKHKAKLGVATSAPPPAAAAIASIAPPPPTTAQPPPPVHESPPPPPPATVPEEVPVPASEVGSDLAEIAARCVLPRPLAQQPKSSKRVICKPTYTADADVTRLGIQLSAGDGVPCAFYHSKSKRLVMGVTLLHDLDAAGAVQTLNANSKDAAGKAAIAAAETALTAAFAAHGADAGLTYEALLKHAGLYGDAPGAEFLHVTYQTIERFINALPAPPPGLAAAADVLPAAVAAALPARRKRAPAAATAAAVDAFDSDDDDAALLGVDVQHDRPRAAMDREAAEVAAELGLDGGDDDGAEPRAVDPLGGAMLPDDDDDDADVLMAPEDLDADPVPPPVPPPPAKTTAKRKAPPAAARDVLLPPPKRARVDAAPPMPPAHADAEETQFRRAMLFAAILQHGSTLAGRALWDVLKKDIYCLYAAGSDAEEAEFVLAQVFAALSYDHGSGVRDDRQLWALIRRSLA